MAIEVDMDRRPFDLNRQQVNPLPVPRTRRNHLIATLTSFPAGKCVPIVSIPMLREDALNARVTISCEMQETKELLMNPVYLRVSAYCVPFLAFDRFEGSRDQFDRSYMGEPKIEGGAVVPFIETAAMGAHGANALYKALGLHAKSTDLVNTGYMEAYNLIWNYRATNRSPLLTKRNRLEATLAPAFWQSTRFEHVVPDFDQAVIDGEVPLNVVNGDLSMRGLTLTGGYDATRGHVRIFRDHTPATAVQVNNVTATNTMQTANTNPGANATLNWYLDLTKVVAELQEDGITVSLSNIEVARKTQAFAKLRERYEGFDDEWIIDMLMSGLRVPDQALKQPFLIADRTATFGQSKRYSTDADALAESAVSGGARMDLSIRVPQLSTGGIVMLIAEAMPEQLFERQKDPYFHSTDHAAWPEFLRDTLDPEKVDVVLNSEIDTDHTVPASTFGYAPMNWKWNAMGPRVGGKFYRPTSGTANDAERMRIWALETVDPALGEDFYLVTNIHQKPFLDPLADPFELSAVGNGVLSGNTVFGGALVEATGNYDEIMSKVPFERIVKPATEEASAQEGGE